MAGPPGCVTRIQQTRNARMTEGSEDLPLLQERVPQGRLRSGVANNLDCHPLFHLAIGALRQKDRAHAAVSEQADQFIRAAAALFARTGVGIEELGNRGRHESAQLIRDSISSRICGGTPR